jgi:hypothetical protein
LEDEEVRAALIERGKKRIHDFDWKRSARATLEFYRTVAGQAAS